MGQISFQYHPKLCQPCHVKFQDPLVSSITQDFSLDLNKLLG